MYHDVAVVADPAVLVLDRQPVKRAIADPERPAVVGIATLHLIEEAS